MYLLSGWRDPTAAARQFESDGHNGKHVSKDYWRGHIDCVGDRVTATCGELASVHASWFCQDLLRTEILLLVSVVDA